MLICLMLMCVGIFKFLLYILILYTFHLLSGIFVLVYIPLLFVPDYVLTKVC